MPRFKVYANTTWRNILVLIVIASILIWLITNAPDAHAKPPKPPKAKSVNALEDGSVGQILINDGNGNTADWIDMDSAYKGDSGTQGIQGSQGVSGVDGKDGLKGDTGATGKGLRDRYEVGVELRILDTRKFSLNNYYIYDTNNDNHTLGLRVEIKLGKSYEEKLIEKLREEVVANLRLK